MWLLERLSPLKIPLFVYFPVAAYVGLVELIYLNDLLDDITVLLSTNQSGLLILSRPETAMHGGHSHDLKKITQASTRKVTKLCKFDCNVWEICLSVQSSRWLLAAEP